MTNSDNYRLSTFCKNMNWISFPYVLVYAYYYGSMNVFYNNSDQKYTERASHVSLSANPHDLMLMNDQEHLEFYKVRQGYEAYLEKTNAHSASKEQYRSYFENELRVTDTPVLNYVKKQKSIRKIWPNS